MRVVTAISFLLLCAGTAAAASLDIEGTYGSPAGCKYAADGVYGDEEVSILDAEHYENFVTWCEFVQVIPVRDGSSVVTMLCGHEGEEYQTIDMVRIARSAEGDGYTIFHANGDAWDSVALCRPKNEQGR
jgi:hypothetical protein